MNNKLLEIEDLHVNAEDKRNFKRHKLNYK